MVDTNRYDEFAHLLQRSAGQIVAYLHALLLNWSDAEDVFQEACLVLLGEIRPVASRAPISSAGAACRRENKALNFRRTEARRARFWRPEVQVALMAAVSDRDAAAAGDSLAALAVCMDRLSEGDRRLVQRCYGDRVPVPADRGRAWPLAAERPQLAARVRTLLLECIQEVREDEP